MNTTLWPFSVAVAANRRSCSPTPVTKDEAISEIRTMPEALRLTDSTQSVDAVDWHPTGSFRTTSFYLFMVMAPRPEDVPLGNGLIGYFGVNKWTADILEMNSPKSFVLGPALRKYQNKLRRNHCLNSLISSHRTTTFEGK
jgi:hypothetical protein